MSQTSTPSPQLSRHRVQTLAVSAALHLLAIAVLSASFCWLFLNDAAMQVLPGAFSVDELRAAILDSLAIVIGLAACAWSLMVIVSVLVKQRVRENKLNSLRRARGTIITETLIVLPVFFMLTFGLAQMGINSMAGLLSAVATYEAGRTIAVWGPEVGHNRSGNGAVSQTVVQDRARIVAAGILTPIVPNLPSGQACTVSDAMNQNLAGMVGALGVPGPDDAPRGMWSFKDALDTQSFAGRGVTKFRAAYCATRVTYTNSIITDPDSNARATFTTTVEYHHPIVMPMVGPIFASDFGAGTWGTPNVTTFNKSYTLTQQLSPNPERPQSNAFRKLIGSLPQPSLD